jgi:para-nitrobenzyl esterase
MKLINTKSGPIQGLETDGVYAYKGIPYAKAPVGELRFAPPQDREPWTEVRDCTQCGPIAVQKVVLPYFLDNHEQSEDCLSLNVWTPSAPNTSDKLPVYVFIHGGGYAAWTGNDKTFDGTSFAQNGVVAVTINYRLSTLGFFASQETYNQYGTTGNWGTLDQIKALQWVRDNIAAFGGDPDKVTIGGESAGAWSVTALILSPLAKGLFRGAIVESGSILGLQSFIPARGNMEKAIEASRAFAGIFGASDSAEGLQQLRQVDADVLNHLAPLLIDQTTAVQAFFYVPVFDGAVLPKDPIAALKAGNYNKVNLLIGFNRDEGPFFIPSSIDSIYKTIAAIMVGKDWRSFVERFPVDEQNNATQRTQQLLAYAWFSTGEKLFADTLSPDNKVFVYNFNFVASDDPLAALGVYHTAELVYAFNTIALKGLASEESKKMVQEVHTRWANFIKSGDPNVGAAAPSAVVWPQYDKAKTDVLFFDNEITTGPLPDKDNLDFTVQLFYGIDN